MIVRDDGALVYIKINRIGLMVTPGVQNTRELRRRANVPDDHDLYVIGPEMDERITNPTVDCESGMRMFSVPKYINNSASVAQ